ncbi:transporter substrate-binding domain-containing protein [Paraglaciecola aquimarina]|uniref:Transporter substrate-binding domain-containing protein n=1 Tax=Paraglaciecola aquimarina TaxID=1235557 RepID=A0ABU3SRL8_9ALTE|nr:transporter substrate-binding domain-containing protein [Paraglaciecola aquimarina]MDU0352661.1 transporter substrate-binding domain-containing protein [Paraglaciecola aquimarina]
MFAVAQLCWAILLANSALAKEPTATDKSLRLAVIHIEVPPYIYTDENQEYKGIYPLVAQALGREMGLQLIYVPTARNGLEELISEGKADLTWLSPNWVKNTQDANFIFSDPILVHREFLFSFVPFDSSKGISDWLDNKSVCVRQDYQYPSLKPFFDKKIAHPIEVSSQTPMMNLFRKGRCDLLYSDEYRVTMDESTVKSETQNLAF